VGRKFALYDATAGGADPRLPLRGKAQLRLSSLFYWEPAKCKMGLEKDLSCTGPAVDDPKESNRNSGFVTEPTPGVQRLA
jgi:hypothetical protein